MNEIRTNAKDRVLQKLFEGTIHNEEAFKFADAFLNDYMRAVMDHVLARIHRLIATVGPFAPRRKKLATFESIPLRDFLDDFSSPLLEPDVPLRELYYNLACEVTLLSTTVAEILAPSRRRGPRRNWD